MNKIFKASLVALAVAFGASSTAHAGLFDFDPAEGGIYLSGFVGASFPSSTEVDGVDLEFNDPTYFGGAIGARLPFKYWKYFQPRLELEASTFESDIGLDSSALDAGQSISGDQDVKFYLINNSSDFIWKEDQRFIPYFGGGIGIADYETNITLSDVDGDITVSSDDTGFATVSTIGGTFKATNQVDLYVEGRYLRTYGINDDLEDLQGDIAVDVDDDPQGFTLTVGTRINF